MRGSRWPGQPFHPTLGWFELAYPGRRIVWQEPPPYPSTKAVPNPYQVAVGRRGLYLRPELRPPEFDVLSSELMKEPQPQLVSQPFKNGFLASYGCLSEAGLDDRPVAVLHVTSQGELDYGA
jgi:hypothetical protein